MAVMLRTVLVNAIPQVLLRLGRLRGLKQEGRGAALQDPSAGMTVNGFVQLMKDTGLELYKHDSRAALDLFHRINESGSGFITPGSWHHQWIEFQTLSSIVGC